MIDPQTLPSPSLRPNPLTAMADRQALVAFLTNALAHSERRRKRVAVVCIRISLPASASGPMETAPAQGILAEAAKRIQVSIREADFASRVEADEFVVVAQEIDGRSGAETMVRRLLQSLLEPIQLEAEAHLLDAHIGVAIFPLHGSQPQELLQVAHKAMHHAREQTESDFTILE